MFPALSVAVHVTVFGPGVLVSIAPQLDEATPEGQSLAFGEAVTPDFSKGLVPAVVQDAGSGRVLMLAYMDEDAWRKTRESGRAWFHSRERGLWEKGATSGNTMEVVEVVLDCDLDSVLLRVHPAGPACHTGEESCFFNRPD